MSRELAEILRKACKLGRLPLPEDQRKLQVTLYLDRDVLARLRADGRGWQTRANAALRKALGL
ncbi:BrnA antitoxin family protein [Palleronia sp. KMU-117]|uniref:BrnA antitoxin family protein n=1 Tax=Palleronia sp. KMU-117 TaxID=3434108 RepID=UPI003D72DB70